jgi:hypothetical protein
MCYKRKLKEWDTKLIANKTWDNFKVFFLVAQTNLLFSQRATASCQGYGHFAADTPNTYADISNALVLLAITADLDRAAFAPITTSNQQLTQQLADTLNRLGDLEAKLDKSSNVEPTRRRGLPQNKNYCHTHGYIIADTHTSATCNSKAEGHKNTAFRAKIMGCSTKAKIP